MRYGNFRSLLVGRFSAHVANTLAPIAIAFAVLDLDGSARAVGVVIACRVIPQIALTLFGGVIADRFDRSRVLVLSCALCVLTQAFAGAAILLLDPSIWMVAAIEAANGAVSAFAVPAASGLLPQTVPAVLLQQANALVRLSVNAAVILGAPLGGLLVGISGPGWALIVDAIAFAVASASFARVRLRRSGRARPVDINASPGRVGLLADLRGGWVEFSSRSWLWSVVLAFAFINAAEAGALGVLGPLIADLTFGRVWWGVILGAIAVGMAIGGALALFFRPRRTLVFAMFGICLVAPLLAGLAFESGPWATFLLAVVCGMGIETFGVYWDLSLQEHVPGEALSRVYSYDALGSWVLMPVGLGLAGVAAAEFGAPQTMVGAAVIVLFAGIVPVLLPSVRRLERANQG